MIKLLSVFICEDNPTQLQQLENVIKTYIMIEDYDMHIELSTTNPYELIDYMEQTEDVRGIYFLDIDFEMELDGIKLASLIRKKDIDAKIIFITTHSDLLSLTFTYKVEAMDYIIKDDPKLIRKRIHECLDISHDYYFSPKRNEENRLKFKINNQIRYFDLQDIMFFETTDTPHKIRLHLTNGTIELYESLTDIEIMSESFIRIHKSFLINKDNVKLMDSQERTVTMNNGETCLISVRKMKLLK